MKKVRFESPIKSQAFIMNDSECHSPRPFTERKLHANPTEPTLDYTRVLTYTTDPVQRFENSNSSPYPVMNRLHMPSFLEKQSCWKPSHDLNLSLLDASNHEPRKPTFCKSILKENSENKLCGVVETNSYDCKQKPLVLSSIENKINDPPNVLVKDNGFFLKRDNLDKYNLTFNSMQMQFNKLNLDKENDPLARKAELMKTATLSNTMSQKGMFKETMLQTVSDECRCHHCIKNIEADHLHNCQQPISKRPAQHQSREQFEQNCKCSFIRKNVCSHCDCITPPIQQNLCKTCNCHSETPSPTPQNAIDKKTWAIQKYEQNKQQNCTDVEKQTNVSKEKREPTVADLFKIIKLQNEQLQLLQEKVDKFISRQTPQPTITCSTECVAVNTVQNDEHKMSIGVMTSFEMIRTSTVINKEIVKQTNENAQIQCNRSQISIKEVLSKPVNVNFLDGIVPKNAVESEVQNDCSIVNNAKQIENVCEEKTLNELSLCNVQVDNATTPLMSPDQTMYLDVRDYSDSEASSNDQSNVGWTYYNKVMTHVNGMLQDSEMPSSASAMYRNMRQQCVQMQIDKTNVSVTKRVKFGDDPLGLHQPHIYATPTTETSLKMNQLAAKYLKNVPPNERRPSPSTVPIDMSIATRNYMEKHRLLQGVPTPTTSPLAGEIPRFLDITALKQQPKFL